MLAVELRSFVPELVPQEDAIKDVTLRFSNKPHNKQLMFLQSPLLDF